MRTLDYLFQAMFWRWAELGRLHDYHATGTAKTLWYSGLQLPSPQGAETRRQRWNHQERGELKLSRFNQFMLAIVCKISHFYCDLPFIDPQENGWPNSQVSNCEWRDLCHFEQIPEVWGWREHACRTRPMLSASNPSVTGQQLRRQCTSLKQKRVMIVGNIFREELSLWDQIHCHILLSKSPLLHFIKPLVFTEEICNNIGLAHLRQNIL